jgi:hypothetical protein
VLWLVVFAKGGIRGCCGKRGIVTRITRLEYHTMLLVLARFNPLQEHYSFCTFYTPLSFLPLTTLVHVFLHSNTVDSRH